MLKYTSTNLESSRDVLFLLHGYRQNPTVIEKQVLPFISNNQSIFSLQAPLEINPKQFAWANVDTNARPLNHNLQELKESSEQILETINEILKTIHHQVRTVSLFGFSQGGVVGLESLHHPKTTFNKAVFANSCFALGTETNKPINKAADILLLNGDTDHFVSHNEKEQMFDILQAKGASVKFKNFPSGHILTEEMLVELSKFI